MIIDCKSIAQDIKNKIKNIIAKADYAPVLLIYQIGTTLHLMLIFAASHEIVKRLKLKQNISSYQRKRLKMN